MLGCMLRSEVAVQKGIGEKVEDDGDEVKYNRYYYPIVSMESCVYTFIRAMPYHANIYAMQYHAM